MNEVLRRLRGTTERQKQFRETYREVTEARRCGAALIRLKKKKKKNMFKMKTG